MLKRSDLMVEMQHPEQQLLLAMLAFRQGDQNRARQLLDAGTALMEQAAPANPRLLMIQQEAAMLLGVVVPVGQDVSDAPVVPTN